MTRRRINAEPARCICQVGGLAHPQHAKPGKKVGLHLNPKCPHTELRHTTRPAPKKVTVTRLRLQ